MWKRTVQIGGDGGKLEVVGRVGLPCSTIYGMLQRVLDPLMRFKPHPPSNPSKRGSSLLH